MVPGGIFVEIKPTTTPDVVVHANMGYSPPKPPFKDLCAVPAVVQAAVPSVSCAPTVGADALTKSKDMMPSANTQFILEFCIAWSLRNAISLLSLCPHAGKRIAPISFPFRTATKGPTRTVLGRTNFRPGGHFAAREYRDDLVANVRAFAQEIPT